MYTYFIVTDATPNQLALSTNVCEQGMVRTLRIDIMLFSPWASFYLAHKY